MKNFRCFTAILFIATTLCFTACSEEETPYLSVSNITNNTINFDAEGGTHSLHLKTNQNWSIQTSSGDWCDVSETNGGKGEYIIDISVSSNKGEARNTKLIIIGGEITHEVSITQKEQDEAYINSEISSLDFSDEAGSQSITFEINRDWRVNNSVDWIKITPAEGKEGTNEITVQVERNERLTEREATIQILSIDADKQISITIAQEKTRAVDVDVAGTLPQLILESEKYQVKELVIKGNLNGTDIRFIREMLGRDSEYKQTAGQLSILDLSDANIVEGGEAYLLPGKFEVGSGSSQFNDYLYTENNSISFYMFFLCNNLTKTTLPKSINDFSIYAFELSEGLKEISIPDGNSVYSSYSGILFNKQKTETVFVPKNIEGEIILPNALTSLPSNCFSNRINLTSVTIPNSVTAIGNSAFSGCTSLTSITIPNSVTSIGGWAFWSCSSLTNITIPNSVKLIEDYTFAYCSSLTSITIPNSVTTIGQHAFQECTGLTSVAIGNSVKLIDNGAFHSCTSLTKITIPNSVTAIGANAFEGCSSLKSIHVERNTPPAVVYYSISSKAPNDTCILYVPEGSYNAYRYAQYWKDFESIVEE